MSPRQEVYNILEVLVQENLITLVDGVTSLVERTVIDALETCSVDHDKAVVKEVLRTGPNSLNSGEQILDQGVVRVHDCTSHHQLDSCVQDHENSSDLPFCVGSNF